MADKGYLKANITAERLQQHSHSGGPVRHLKFNDYGFFDNKE